MVAFSIGDQVIIRFGARADQLGTIIKSGPGNAYTVRAEDGSVHNFTEKGLARAQPEPAPSAAMGGKAPRGDNLSGQGEASPPRPRSRKAG
jgi:hypothetical protein